MKKIFPCLWFDDQAEEAMNFYTSIFKNSKPGTITRYGDEGPGPKGKVMTATFFLDGQEFMALNGGPEFKFSEAISFVVNCKSQEEIDELWDKLTADGGEPSMCGWLKDKFGVSWQIVPEELEKLLTTANAAQSQRVTNALLQMRKLDIGVLKQAYEQG